MVRQTVLWAGRGRIEKVRDEVDSFGVSLVRSTKATRSSCQHSPSDSDRVLLAAEMWRWRLRVGSGFLVADPLEVSRCRGCYRANGEDEHAVVIGSAVGRALLKQRSNQRCSYLRPWIRSVKSIPKWSSAPFKLLDGMMRVQAAIFGVTENDPGLTQRRTWLWMEL